jgi:uncharacterized membrane protein YgaE (UPF0421/DUF939 family)
MAGALVFGAVCGFIVALLFAPILPTDEKDQIEKAQKEQKEQAEKEQKDRKDEIEKQQKERKEKPNHKGKSEQREKSEQTDKNAAVMASKNEMIFCIKNCPDVWRVHRD